MIQSFYETDCSLWLPILCFTPGIIYYRCVGSWHNKSWWLIVNLDECQYFWCTHIYVSLLELQYYNLYVLGIAVLCITWTDTQYTNIYNSVIKCTLCMWTSTKTSACRDVWPWPWGRNFWPLPWPCSPRPWPWPWARNLGLVMRYVIFFNGCM